MNHSSYVNTPSQHLPQTFALRNKHFLGTTRPPAPDSGAEEGRRRESRGGPDAASSGDSAGTSQATMAARGANTKGNLAKRLWASLCNFSVNPERFQNI